MVKPALATLLWCSILETRCNSVPWNPLLQRVAPLNEIHATWEFFHNRIPKLCIFLHPNHSNKKFGWAHDWKSFFLKAIMIDNTYACTPPNATRHDFVRVCDLVETFLQRGSVRSKNLLFAPCLSFRLWLLLFSAFAFGNTKVGVSGRDHRDKFSMTPQSSQQTTFFLIFVGKCFFVKNRTSFHIHSAWIHC